MSKVWNWSGVILVLVSLVAVGCGGGGGTAKTGGKGEGKGKAAGKTVDPGVKEGGEHGHGAGPHGGTIIEFGAVHGELTVDHPTQQATVYILGEDAKTAMPIEWKNAQLSVKSPQFQVSLTASPLDGETAAKASRYVGKHEHLAKEQEFEGSISGLVDGKPYSGDFKEEPGHDHKGNQHK